MKTDFAARPVFVQREDRIQAHFLVCFLALLIYRLLEKKLGKKYTCDEILSTLKEYEFADIQGQGFIPIYEWLGQKNRSGLKQTMNLSQNEK